MLTAKQSGADKTKSLRIDSTSAVPTAFTVLMGNMVKTENTAKMDAMDPMEEEMDRMEPMVDTEHRVLLVFLSIFSGIASCSCIFYLPIAHKHVLLFESFVGKDACHFQVAAVLLDHLDRTHEMQFWSSWGHLGLFTVKLT